MPEFPPLRNYIHPSSPFLTCQPTLLSCGPRDRATPGCATGEQPSLLRTRQCAVSRSDDLCAILLGNDVVFPSPRLHDKPHPLGVPLRLKLQLRRSRHFLVLLSTI